MSRFQLPQPAPSLSAAHPWGSVDLTGELLGRDELIASVLVAIEEARLVTLWGPVGVGKSRLALEVARRHEPDVSVVRAAVAASSDEVEASIVHAIDNAAALVVIDGIDRFVPIVRRVLGERLAGVGDLRVLMTSRTPVGVAAERIVVVPMLALPAADPDPDRDDDVNAESPAARLVVDRLAARSGLLELTPATVASVNAIARASDGLPLAVEELARWSPALSPFEIAERRGELVVATGGALAAAVADAMTLLDEADRRLLATLSVFTGWFGPDAAEFVAAGNRVEVLGGLRHLVDASWLAVEVRGDGTTYRLPEPIRRIVSQSLAGRDDEAAIRARHLEHLTALADRSQVELIGPNRAMWLARMTSVGDGIEQALAWSVDSDPLAGLRLATALWSWWLTCGRLAEGRRWLGALGNAADEPSPELAANAACAAAVLAAEGGDYDEAIQFATRARDGFVVLGDLDGQARAATVLGSAARYLGRYDAAREHFESALESRRVLGDDRGLATAMNNIALAARDAGDLETARTRFEESLLIKRRLKESRSAAIGLANLADVLIRGGMLGQAQDALFEAAVIASDLGDRQLLATIACNLGDVMLLQGDHGTAIEHFTSSLEAYQSSGGAHDLVPALCGLAEALAATGRTSEAVARLREAEALSTASDNPTRIAEVRAALAKLGHSTKIALPGGLTPRQAEILRLVAAGAPNKSLASQLKISVATVERHLATIYQKLNVASRVEAARYAIDHGLAAAVRSEHPPSTGTEYSTSRS